MRVLSKQEIEAEVVSAFASREVKISSVEIVPVGDKGAWRIGEATRPAFTNFRAQADDVANALNQEFLLAQQGGE